ncbi:MAG: diacylglycerol kinase family lipid kinase [bacterium]
MKSIHIIINPGAGKKEPVLSIINASMKEAGIRWEASITHQAGDATRFAKAAAKEGIDALAVYGGDGTLKEAISGLIGSEVPLVILPGGSANIMATELGIPIDLEEACTLLSHGPIRTRAIDIGQFDKRYFIVGVSLGFEADIVNGTDSETKNKIGVLAYFLSAVRALRITKKAVYHLKVDGQEYEIQGLTCLVANTGNFGFGSISLDRHIDVSDGFLDVVVLRKANLSLLRLAAVMLLKRERPDNLELVEHWQGRDISVSASPEQMIQCDGEVLEKPPLHIKVVPGAIRVVVPEAN